MKKHLILLLFISSFLLNAQTNKFDAQGKRHGLWKKFYRNGNIRYFGSFNHGKEKGVFKYYSLASSKQPIFIKKFNDIDDFAIVSFFTEAGRLLSKGKMQGKLRVGKWVYYRKDGKTKLQEEFYVNGKLEGKYTTFFENKKPTIEANYKNGLLDGPFKRYSIKGHVYQDLNYIKGVLNGEASYYNRLTADLIKKGQYKNDKKVGVWEYFYKGELIDTIDYSNIKRYKK